MGKKLIIISLFVFCCINVNANVCQGELIFGKYIFNNLISAEQESLMINSDGTFEYYFPGKYSVRINGDWQYLGSNEIILINKSYSLSDVLSSGYSFDRLNVQIVNSTELRLNDKKFEIESFKTNKEQDHFLDSLQQIEIHGKFTYADTNSMHRFITLIINYDNTFRYYHNYNGDVMVSGKWHLRDSTIFFDFDNDYWDTKKGKIINSDQIMMYDVNLKRISDISNQKSNINCTLSSEVVQSDNYIIHTYRNDFKYNQINYFNILDIKKDGTFLYYMSYIDDYISGSWERVDDYKILLELNGRKSDYFLSLIAKETAFIIDSDEIILEGLKYFKVNQSDFDAIRTQCYLCDEKITSNEVVGKYILKYMFGFNTYAYACITLNSDYSSEYYNSMENVTRFGVWRGLNYNELLLEFPKMNRIKKWKGKIKVICPNEIMYDKFKFAKYHPLRN